MSTAPIELVVYGRAQPAGSKRIGRAGRGPGARPIILDDARGSRDWKNAVAQAAGAYMGDRPPLDGPLRVCFRFYEARPRGHYGKRGLRPSAPRYPTKKPDVLKLARAVEDALSGIVYRDDKQTIALSVAKNYGTPERVEIVVGPVSPEVLPL